MRKNKSKKLKEVKYTLESNNNLLQDLLVFAKDNIDDARSFFKEVTETELRPLLFAKDEKLSEEQLRKRDYYKNILNYLRSFSGTDKGNDFFNDSEKYFDIMSDIFENIKYMLLDHQKNYLEQALINMRFLETLPFPEINFILRAKPHQNYRLTYMPKTPNIYPKAPNPYEENIFLDGNFTVTDEEDYISLDVIPNTYVIKIKKGYYHSLVTKKSHPFITRKIDVYDIGLHFRNMPSLLEMDNTPCSLDEYLALKERKDHLQIEKNNERIRAIQQELAELYRNNSELSEGTNPKTLSKTLPSQGQSVN